MLGDNRPLARLQSGRYDLPFGGIPDPPLL